MHHFAWQKEQGKKSNHIYVLTLTEYSELLTLVLQIHIKMSRTACIAVLTVIERQMLTSLCFPLFFFFFFLKWHLLDQCSPWAERKWKMWQRGKERMVPGLRSCISPLSSMLRDGVTRVHYCIPEPHRWQGSCPHTWQVMAFLFWHRKNSVLRRITHRYALLEDVHVLQTV